MGRSRVGFVGIGDLPKPASYDGSLLHCTQEWLHFSFRPVNEGYQSQPFKGVALPSATGQMLKAQARKECPDLSALPDSRIRLLYRGVELQDSLPIAGYLGAASGETIELELLVLQSTRHPDAAEVTGAGLEACRGVPCSRRLAEAVEACGRALRLGAQPTLADGGTSGTYFLWDALETRKLAVFKPKCEEVGAPLNPRGFLGRENTHQWRLGVASAQRAVREVAASLLDHKGFAGVPETTLVRARHRAFVPILGTGKPEVVWKVGALQDFVNTSETAENFGPSAFSVADTHKVGILDVRIVNGDRNEGNLLVKVSKDRAGVARRYELVPIDHGWSLPDRLVISDSDVVWMSWPQAREPFSEEALRFIAGLDGAADARMLAETLGLERDGLRLLEVTTRWLQIGAAKGLTLHGIGSALYRADSRPERPSEVELAVRCSLDTALASRAGQAPGLQRLLSTPSPEEVRAEPNAARRIFSKRTSQGKEVEWSQDLEEAFRRHINQALEQLAARMKPASPRLSSCGSTQDSKPISSAPGADCSDSAEEPSIDLAWSEGKGDAEPPPPELQRTESSSVEQFDLPPRSEGAYVPPHLRLRVKKAPQ